MTTGGGALGSALTTAAGRFTECSPEAADDPRVVEVALAAARVAALDRDASERVTYVRVPIAGGDPRPVLGSVRDLVAGLRADSRLGRWWWMEKADAGGHHLRLRLHGPATIPLEELESLLPTDGAGVPLRVLAYEPELALFGGFHGVRIAHRFHHVDSQLLVGVIHGATSAVRAPHGLTVRAFEALMRGAELDAFERWDMWRLAARQRPLPPEAEEEVARDRDSVAWVTSVLRSAEQQLAGDDGGFLQPYVDVGRELGRAYRDGLLERGMRQVIAAAFVFHGNRARLGYAAQARLSRAAAAACDPMPLGEGAGSGT